MPGNANKTALVTGGASGIGRAFVEHLQKENWTVCVLDENRASLETLSSPNVSTHACDVTDLGQIEATVESIRAQYGVIDRLIHCAAIMPAGKLATMNAATINHLTAVNYGGTVNVVQTVLADMLARDSGEIIVFGSAGGAVPVPDCGAYCATKAATNLYVEILAEENRRTGVQFMLVCPPLVNTPLLTQAVSTGNPKTVADSLEKERYMTPDQIVRAVERGLEQKTVILWPSTEAKVLQWFRRFSPRLVWRLIHAVNE
ncbi:MAG: SDR family oxidoreductase [Pseudomonadota bacterium]